MTFLSQLQQVQRQPATATAPAQTNEQAYRAQCEEAAIRIGRQQAQAVIETIRELMLEAAKQQRNHLEIREWEGLEPPPADFQRDDFVYGAFIREVQFLLGPDFEVTGFGSFEVYDDDPPGMEHSKSIHIRWRRG